jgi:hypothetical protein
VSPKDDEDEYVDGPQGGSNKFADDTFTWVQVGYEPPTKLNSDEVTALWLDAQLDRPPRISGDDAKRVYDKLRRQVIAARKAGIILEAPSDIYENTIPVEPKRMKIVNPDNPAYLPRTQGTYYFAATYRGEIETIYRVVHDGHLPRFFRLAPEGWVQDDDLMRYFLGMENGLRELADVTESDLAAYRQDRSASGTVTATLPTRPTSGLVTGELMLTRKVKDPHGRIGTADAVHEEYVLVSYRVRKYGIESMRIRTFPAAWLEVLPEGTLDPEPEVIEED